MLSKQVIHPQLFLKATLLFFSANALILSLHELSHATTAYLLKVPSTLFHFYVDLNQNGATESDRIIIALAGPVFSLLAGVLFWVLYKKSATATTKLLSLYAAIIGGATFFGNLFSTAMVGDFGRVTQLLHFTQQSRYLISTFGFIALCIFMLGAGREFLNMGLFVEAPKKATILNGILIPWLLGTGLVILIYIPLPVSYTIGIISSSVFWIFSIVGAMTGKPTANPTLSFNLLLTITDIVVFVISVVIVRILVSGIYFNP